MEKIMYKLESFEGPLDLLLHLISKNKLNIYDVQISDLLDQYLGHINMMKELDMDIASEFLEMAARLVFIKTAFLLPKPDEAEKLKEELTGQLLEYQECKEVAKLMEKSINLDYISRDAMPTKTDQSYGIKHNVSEVLRAYLNSMGRNRKKTMPQKEDFSQIVSKKIVSVASRVIFVIKKLCKNKKASYVSFFENSKSKSEMVATFLAILELVKGKRVKIVSGENKEPELELNGGVNFGSKRS